MRIRPALAADCAALAEVAWACFGASAWTAEQFAPGAGKIVLLAEAAGAVPCPGYIALQVAADEAEVQALAVEAGRRRAGLGGALLDAGLKWAEQHGARTVFLEVREGNQAARAFYLRHGFADCGRRPGYYHAPEEAAILMRRRLA